MHFLKNYLFIYLCIWICACTCVSPLCVCVFMGRPKENNKSPGIRVPGGCEMHDMGAKTHKLGSYGKKVNIVNLRTNSAPQNAVIEEE